jgi:hypothetical protein
VFLAGSWHYLIKLPMTIRNLMTRILLPVFLLQSGLTSVAAAQDFNPDPDWKITVDLWVVSLDGTLGMGPIVADVDVP